MPYFQAFQPFSVTVTFFMNSITFVMNHLFSYFDISICHSSNRTLSYRLLLTHGFNHGYILGVQVHQGNIHNSELIQVKESLDFSNYSVNLCQNKKTENHLRKMVFAVKSLTLSPGGFNHSVPMIFS